MHQNRFSETTLSASTAAAIERSPQVAAWLVAAVAGRLGWPADACSVHAVHHSFTDSSLDSRETDILVIYRAGEARTYWMMVELKINAPFGENQPQDYVARKAKTVAFKRCDACATVVIAPQGYLEAHPRDVRLFDVAVSLEALRQAAATSTDLSAKLLDAHIGMAMEIFKVGYMPLADALRESQFEWYGMFVHDYKPHLVPNPSNASKQARDIFYSIPDQNRGYITHRIFAGEVSMGFMQRGHLLDSVQDAMAPGETDVRAERRGTSLYFVLNAIPVPALDEGRGFAEQELQVKDGVDAVDRLYQWSLRHRDMLSKVVANHLP